MNLPVHLSIFQGHRITRQWGGRRIRELETSLCILQFFDLKQLSMIINEKLWNLELYLRNSV